MYNCALGVQEHLHSETVMITDSIARTRARIVQSPERIKRTITTMGTTVIEEKKAVISHETKARELQAKINALFSIEKVWRPSTLRQTFNNCVVQDIRSCIEQLQTIEKEATLLETSRKELAEMKDHLDVKKIDYNELQMKHDVCLSSRS